MSRNFILDQGPGTFVNRQGYHSPKIRDDPYWCFGFLLKTPIYSFDLDPVNALTWRYANGVEVQPNKHMAETDRGSTPKCVHALYPPDRFLLSFFFHDSGAKDGGLFVRMPGETLFTFRKMTRAEVDSFLLLGVPAEGGTRFDKQAIYWPVRGFSWIPWNRYRKAESKTGLR